MIIYIYLISFTIINSFLFYYKTYVEHFYNTVNSFDEVLDNLCSSTVSNGNDQYNNGECVVSDCPLETCYKTSGSSLVPETSKQDLYNGECVSKQQTKRNAYNCTPYVEPSPPPPPPSPSTYVAPQSYEERTYGQQTSTTTPLTAPGYSSSAPGYSSSAPGYSSSAPVSGYSSSAPAPGYSSSAPAPAPGYSSSAPAPAPGYSSSAPVSAPFVTTTPVTATAKFVLTPSSEQKEPNYLKHDYAEIKDCEEYEYWNHDNQQCTECSSDYVLKNRRGVTSSAACKEKVDCIGHKVKCYTPECAIEYKDKIVNEEDNSCDIPTNCDFSCTKPPDPCPRNPRTPCVHPEDKTFQRYRYNNTCELESVVDPGKTITSCERCRRYTRPDGTVVNQRLKRENGVVVCKEI